MCWRCQKTILVLCVNLILCVNLAAANPRVAEDSYIFEALEALDKNRPEEALKIYEKLYESTKKAEYLKEIVRLLLALGRYEEVIARAKGYEGGDVGVKYALANAYMALNDDKNAILAYEEVLRVEESLAVRKILGNLYANAKDFDAARRHLAAAYKEENDEHTLLMLATIDISQKKFLRSAPLIRAYFEAEPSAEFAQVLIALALENDALGDVLGLFEHYYKKNKSEANARNLVQIYALMERPKDALAVAKNHNLGDEMMFELYLLAKDYESVKTLATTRFEETRDDRFLGILAIAEFESSADKRAVIKSVVEKFEKALNAAPSDVFYNYLGYLLIDFDLDIERGIALVKKALEINPKSPAYIDSLAWGLYKKGDCAAALRTLQTIPQGAIDKEPEIKGHLGEIKKCAGE